MKTVTLVLLVCLTPLVFADSPSDWAEGSGSSDGASRDYYNRAALLKWEHYLGDWRDAKNVAQGDAPYALVELQRSKGERWVEWDVTDLVREWAKGTHPNQGFFLRGTTGSGTYLFASREAEEAEHRPQLVLESDAKKWTLAAEADTYLEPSTYRSQGTGSRLRITAGQRSNSALLRFSLADVPSEAKLRKVTLRLYNVKQYGQSLSIGVFRCAQGETVVESAPVLGLADKYPGDAGLAKDPDVYFADQFENDEWAKGWTYSKGNLDPVAKDADRKFERFQNNALRVRIAKGTTTAMNTLFKFQKQVGEEPESVYFRYYLRLGDDWNQTVQGGKMPGISGTYGRAGWGGRKSNGTNGWSARGSFSKSIPKGNPLGETHPIGTYCYHADQAGPYGNVWVWQKGYRGYLQKNRWYCVEQYLQLNTPGEKDGVLRAWIDGRLAFEKTDIRFRHTDKLKIEQIWMNVYHGGTVPSPYDQHLFVDNVVIAKKYIGPMTRPIHPSDWRTYNYDFKGSRHNVAERRLSVANVGKLEVKWQFPTKGSKEKVGAINATPSVVNGCVYFGTSTYPKFYKLKPNGEIAWVYKVGDETRQRWQRAQEVIGLIPRDGVYSSALVTEDSVYFGDVAGVAYCLDRATGEEKWTINTKAKPFPGAHSANLLMGSPILADGKVVFSGGAFEHATPLQPGYKCCNGRGFVMAVEPSTGKLAWKYDVGPKPEKFDPPLEMQTALGKRIFQYGPSTSSVWSTPSFDPQTNTVFFGTDIHNSPRKPTKADPRNYTPHSAAVIAVDATTGKEKWVTQTNKHDVWNYSMPGYHPKTGYKDQSIGDTPKIYTIQLDGNPVRVVGTGAKSGGFYVMRIDDGKLVVRTPIYTGSPVDNPKVDPRMLALPSVIGGLQTGCATDGKSVFTNGIDSLLRGAKSLSPPTPPTGGRVTSISLDTKTENWRHERPKVPWVGGTKERPLFENCGDPVASGIAVANGCLFFTTFTSNKLVVLDATTGKVLKEIPLRPVLAGPSVSRGRVYIGTGNTQFVEDKSEAFFPKSATGVLYSFGLPSADEIDKMGEGDE